MHFNKYTYTHKTVAPEAKRSQIKDTVDSLWAVLAAEEGRQGGGIGTLLVEAGAGGGGWRGGGRGAGEGFNDWGGREYDDFVPGEVIKTAPSGDETT